jgi:nicotinamidase-related amidase
MVEKKRNPDLHGSAPDNSRVVLLLIDVINDFGFDGGAPLLRHAMPAAKRIAAFKKRCKQAGIPAVYVNDNFGKWRSDFKRLVSHCLNDNTRGRRVVELLKPERDDYFVLKPKHSGFFSTTLDLLLKHLGAETLILTGFTGDICILFTANDAFIRDYRLMIPRDCVVSQNAKENQRALKFMQRVLEADIRGSSKINPRDV